MLSLHQWNDPQGLFRLLDLPHNILYLSDPPIHTAIKVHRCMLSTSGTIKTGVFANNNENTLQVIDEGYVVKWSNSGWT